jgi:quercetin dioxygenase-like cupin family protein
MRRLVRTLVGGFAVSLLAALTAAGLGAQADAKKQAPAAEKKAAPQAAKHVMISEADLKWGPTPDGLPPGGQFAVIDGDPGKPGLFTARVKLPDGYMVQPHSHPTDEHLTILSGSLMVGLGSKWDESGMHSVTAGGYAKMPRRTNHYVKTKGETTFQLSAMGPFGITYVNAKDDPRKKGGTD